MVIGIYKLHVTAFGTEDELSQRMLLAGVQNVCITPKGVWAEGANVALKERQHKRLGRPSKHLHKGF